MIAIKNGITIIAKKKASVTSCAKAAQSQTPLKPRIEAQKKLQIQITKLEGMSSKMQDKDKMIFGRIVKAMQNHDSHYSKLLSGELSQIRKMIKS